MVGIFAGRGDVVLSMGMACFFGICLGWYLRGKHQQFRSWRNRDAA